MYPEEEGTRGPEKDLNHYSLLVWRKKWFIAACAVLGTVLAGVVAYTLPPSYTSTATIIIEDPEIPPELIGTTVTTFADKRLEVINQHIMTTKNLGNIIRKYNLYPELQKDRPFLVVVDRFRSDFKLQRVDARLINPQSGRHVAALISFNLAYEHRLPETAQKVVEELTDLFLAFNTRERVKQANEVVKFLASESERLAEQVTTLESRVAEFKREHSGFVVGQAQVFLDLIHRTEEQIRDIKGEISELDDRKMLLQRELAIAESAQLQAAGDDPTAGMTLPELYAEFTRLSETYGPKHPDVVRLRRRISAHEKRLSNVSNDASGSSSASVTPAAERSNNPAVIRLRAQIANLTSERSRLLNRQKDLEAKLESYEAKALASPQLEQKYLQLVRDYESAKSQYQETKKKQMVAEQASVLENSKKGERFSLLEPPQVPFEPTSPKRKLIMGGGFAFFLLLGLAIVVIRDLLDHRIYSSRQLEAILRSPPLAVVPFLNSKKGKPKRKGGRS